MRRVVLPFAAFLLLPVARATAQTTAMAVVPDTETVPLGRRAQLYAPRVDLAMGLLQKQADRSPPLRADPVPNDTFHVVTVTFGAPHRSASGRPEEERWRQRHFPEGLASARYQEPVTTPGIWSKLEQNGLVHSQYHAGKMPQGWCHT